MSSHNFITLLYLVDLPSSLIFCFTSSIADEIARSENFISSFDLNFEFSLRYLKEKRYLYEFTKLVCEQFESKKVQEQTREMLEYVNKYIEENV